LQQYLHTNKLSTTNS